MAYTINLTNGTIFATIPDGTVNSSSSMVLVGKNVANYGEFLDENFVHLLENSSNTTAPPAPLTGQLWWDSANAVMKVWQGAAWKVISSSTAGASAPSNNVVGDLWFDTANQQLKIWTGAAFLVVGPAYSSASGTAGAIPETINDNTATPHFVTSIYVNNARVAIVSQDAFTPASPISTSFPYVYTGVTLSSAMSGIATYAGNVITVTGNVNGSYFNGVGASFSGNVLGNLNVTGNIAGANVSTPGTVTATGNVSGGNLVTAGAVAATGNVSGGNLVTAGRVVATGNVTGGNITTAGIVSATGNITTTANLAGANLSVSGIANVVGNVSGGNIITAGIVSATGNIVSAANISAQYFIGNGSQLTGLDAAISVSKIENGTSNVQIAATGGNIAMQVAGTANVVVVDATTLYANLATGSIAKTGTNAVGNIGSVSSYFNQVYAAQYNGSGAGLTSVPGANVTGTLGINTTGSAASLTTARNINGTAFNGTANITTATWGTARTITLGSTGKSVDGSANVAWSLSEIGAAAATSGVLTTPRLIGTRETSVAVPASNIDLATGNYFSRTISGSTTLTVSNVPTTGTAVSFILDLTNGGSAAITWWSGVKWPSGVVPALTASGRDVLGFFTYDGGTTWTGLLLGRDVK